jgi:hypothetical protein
MPRVASDCFTGMFPTVTICRQGVAHINRLSDPPECLLTNGSKVTLAPLIAAHIAAGDDVSFPLPNSSTATAEILVTKNSLTGSGRDVYQALIGYVTQPKKDKRAEFFVAAEVCPANLGISSIFFPCKAVREYFYRIPEREGSTGRRTIYDDLQVPCTASPAELRVAFKLRQLELEAKHHPRGEHVLLERAFNILGDPGLRACYNALIKDPEAPAFLPYGGFGSLLVSGERLRDAQTFFARRIIAFLPERHRRRFHAPLRKCEFYSDRALYRDIRRSLELCMDPAVLHQVWDASWNRWKHLLGAKMEVNATFVKSGKYRWHRNDWQLVTWETALPSRLEIKLPADFERQVEAAKRTYQRFGQYSPVLDKIRDLIERKPMEKAEIERMLSAVKIPGDFDVAQISWRPDYDSFFYQQLSRRSRQLYLFRDEYIFALEKVVVVERPQLGNASYLFTKPHSMDVFLAAYTGVSKDDIRRNRANIGEKLGFLGRIVHGSNPRSWAKELRARIGETPEFAAAAITGIG